MAKGNDWKQEKKERTARVARMGEAILARDWAGALRAMEDDGFRASDFTSSVQPDGPGGATIALEEEWFSRCQDAELNGKLLARLAACPSKDGKGRVRVIPTPAALVAALGSRNEAAIAALRARSSRLFESGTTRAGFLRAIANPAWLDAENAPKLRSMLDDFERWLPGDRSAQQILAGWASPMAFLSAVLPNWWASAPGAGFAAIARLAFAEGGLDPMARAQFEDGGSAPLAFLALNSTTPDVFLEFVRAGLDPDAVRIGDCVAGKSGREPRGALGNVWDELVLPESILEPAESFWAKGGTPRGEMVVIFCETEKRPVRETASARELIEAALAAQARPWRGHISQSNTWWLERRQEAWRAGWERWVLSQAAGEAKKSLEATAVAELGAKTSAPAPESEAAATDSTRRAARL
jgi:hypothetical protein